MHDMRMLLGWIDRMAEKGLFKRGNFKLRRAVEAAVTGKVARAAGNFSAASPAEAGEYSYDQAKRNTQAAAAAAWEDLQAAIASRDEDLIRKARAEWTRSQTLLRQFEKDGARVMEAQGSLVRRDDVRQAWLGIHRAMVARLAGWLRDVRLEIQPLDEAEWNNWTERAAAEFCASLSKSQFVNES